MARRWWVVLAALALAVGSALAAGAASAASASAAHTAPAHVFPGHTMITSGAAGAAAARSDTGGTLNVVKSTNWSGYAAHLPRKHVYHSVSASWIQPRAHCAASTGDEFAAFWVGLDGYNSKSVEQTGTDSDCAGATGTTPHYYGWFEMFPAAPVLFKNPVMPGDHISASVTFTGVEKYTLVLKDATQHWTHTVIRRNATLARSSAEVITEAPSSGATGAVLPLADFGTVRFSLIRVNGLILNKETPSRIVMVETPPGTLPLDSTSVLGNSGGAFSNTWIRSS
jgi:Peptidase A4 family